MTHTFRVWAPNAEAVAVEVNGRAETMFSGDDGWWEVTIDDAGPGTSYAFSVDGKDAHPDPRSPSQPEGVHGPSQVVDQTAFEWHDSRWRGFTLTAAIIYEVHVGTFSRDGTFAGVIDRLDHVQALGVNAIELMPVAEFAGARGWGYDGVDLFAPHHAYGGPDGLKRLVDACHERDIAVVMDVVYNHVGPEGNYLTAFGPYFTNRYVTPWGDALNYDGANSDDVRAFVLDNITMWLRDYHCDGVRLDAVHAIVDTSATHLLEDIVGRVESLRDELGRELWVIAESDANDPRLVRERSLGGFGVHAQWSDNFHHALHALLTGEHNGYYVDFGQAEDLCTALRQAFVYTGQYSTYRRRRFGRAIGAVPLNRFLAYSQNHDQVGNRAAGDRLCHIVTEGRVRIAAALTLLSPFLPMVFQGEEWAASTPFQYFTDLGDRQLQQAVSEGRRQEFRAFGWDPADVPDPQAVETFERSRLRWDEIGAPRHQRMLDWYKQLIALRAATPVLLEAYPADVRAWFDAQRGALFYECAGLLVVCNLGSEPAIITEARGNLPVLASQALEELEGGWCVPVDAVGAWRTVAGR
jgi:maltooligosyltrehalose trehalohydrolase